MQGFFENCLRTAKNKYTQLLNTPRGRGANLNNEICEIIQRIEKSIKYGELEQIKGRELIKEFQKIDFSKLAEERAELKKQEKRTN